MCKIKQIIVFGAIVVVIVIVAFIYDTSLVPTKNLETKTNVQELSYKKVPDIILNPRNSNHESYLLSDIHQPVIFLHFWASWCTPCLVELPDILQLAEEMDGKLAIVAVSIDKDMKKLDKFMKRLRKEHGNKVDNPNLYWVIDPDKEISLKTFNVARVPETIVINQDRMMIKKIIGENDWLSQETKNHVTMSLSE